MANVWGDVQHAFDEAVGAKDRKLRILEVNPLAGVRGPDAGGDRRDRSSIPTSSSRSSAAVSADPDRPDVPLYRRQVYAVAVYTKARASEPEALTAADVDLAHVTITIAKQADRGTKGRAGTKQTKAKRVRTIDIEPHVFALVKALVDAPQGKRGRLLHMPPPEGRAELLRKDLRTVGVTREALFIEGDPLQRAIVLGLTHMAVRGDSPIVIQWRGGHTDFKTTQGYLDRGRVEARRIGTPLPELPAELLQPGQEKGGSARVLPTGKTTAPRSSRSHSRSWRPQTLGYGLREGPTSWLSLAACGAGRVRLWPERSTRRSRATIRSPRAVPTGITEPLAAPDANVRRGAA